MRFSSKQFQWQHIHGEHCTGRFPFTNNHQTNSITMSPLQIVTLHIQHISIKSNKILQHWVKELFFTGTFWPLGWQLFLQSDAIQTNIETGAGFREMFHLICWDGWHIATEGFLMLRDQMAEMLSSFFGMMKKTFKEPDHFKLELLGK